MLFSWDIAIFVLATVAGSNWDDRAILAMKSWARELPTVFILEDSQDTVMFMNNNCPTASYHQVHDSNATFHCLKSIHSKPVNYSLVSTAAIPVTGLKSVEVTSDLTKRNSWRSKHLTSESLVGKAKNNKYMPLLTIAPKCSGEYHGVGPCCKFAYALYMSRVVINDIKWMMFIDDDVYVRYRPFLQLLNHYNHQHKILLSPRPNHLWKGTKTNTCYIDDINVVRAQPAVLSQLSIYVMYEDQSRISRIEEENKSNVTLLNKKKKVSKKVKNGEQYEVMSSRKLEERKREAQASKPLTFTSLCALFGISHDDALGIWAWVRAVPDVTLPSRSYVAKASNDSAVFKHWDSSLALIHRVRGSKGTPSMLDLSRYFNVKDDAVKVDASPVSSFLRDNTSTSKQPLQSLQSVRRSRRLSKLSNGVNINGNITEGMIGETSLINTDMVKHREWQLYNCSLNSNSARKKRSL